MHSSKPINHIATPIDHFFRGAFSVDIVLISFCKGKLKVLLQEKDEPPFQNELGLLGKLILPNEDTDKALNDLLYSNLGTSKFYKKQLRAFSEVGRHPLGRVITFAYYGLVPFHLIENIPPSSGLSWHLIDSIPKLSYDHNKILNKVLGRFKKGLLRHPTVFEMLSEEFTISDIISIYEQAFAQKVDASNFSKQVKNSETILPLNKFRLEKRNTGRPPQLYSFNKEKYQRHFKDKIKFNF